jgi:hypothetical protein
VRNRADGRQIFGGAGFMRGVKVERIYRSLNGIDSAAISGAGRGHMSKNNAPAAICGGLLGILAAMPRPPFPRPWSVDYAEGGC